MLIKKEPLKFHQPHFIVQEFFIKTLFTDV